MKRILGDNAEGKCRAVRVESQPSTPEERRRKGSLQAEDNGTCAHRRAGLRYRRLKAWGRDSRSIVGDVRGTAREQEDDGNAPDGTGRNGSVVRVDRAMAGSQQSLMPPAPV